MRLKFSSSSKCNKWSSLSSELRPVRINLQVLQFRNGDERFHVDVLYLVILEVTENTRSK